METSYRFTWKVLDHRGRSSPNLANNASLGFVSLESFSSDNLMLFNSPNPPNFHQTCVFKVCDGCHTAVHILIFTLLRLDRVADEGSCQVALARSEALQGDVIHYGDSLQLVHRGTGKHVVRRNVQLGPGQFQIVLG